LSRFVADWRQLGSFAAVIAYRWLPLGEDARDFDFIGAALVESRRRLGAKRLSAARRGDDVPMRVRGPVSPLTAGCPSHRARPLGSHGAGRVAGLMNQAP
jgi:hypothetical protein